MRFRRPIGVIILSKLYELFHIEHEIVYEINLPYPIGDGRSSYIIVKRTESPATSTGIKNTR